MQEKRKKVILSTRQELTPNNDFIERAEREGIELEKGAVITSEYLDRHYEELCKWINLFTAYPDYYLDIIKPADSEFSLFFYQRFTLRALMRFKDVFITAITGLDSLDYSSSEARTLQVTFRSDYWDDKVDKMEEEE